MATLTWRPLRSSSATVALPIAVGSQNNDVRVGYAGDATHAAVEVSGVVTSPPAVVFGAAPAPIAIPSLAGSESRTFEVDPVGVSEGVVSFGCLVAPLDHSMAALLTVTVAPPAQPNRGLSGAVFAAAALFLAFRRKKGLVLALFVAAATGMGACGGGRHARVIPGNYALRVTALIGDQQAATEVPVTVQ